MGGPLLLHGAPQFGEGLAGYSAEALSASAISMGNR